MAAILGLDGMPYKSAAEREGLPPVKREPPIQIFGRFKTKQEFQSVVQLHDYGQFQLSTWLASQMLTDSRVSAAMDVRCDALVGKKIVWAPGKLNDKGRKAARDIETDFALIAPPTARGQMHRWGLIQGVKVAQRHWYVAASGRAIPKIEPYSTQWLIWDWSMWAYRLMTWRDGWRLLQSPALSVPGEPWSPMTGATGMEPDDARLWSIYEPYGVHSWRDEQNLLHSLWEVYFGHALANNDMNRVCERQGRGQTKLYYPRGVDKTSRDEYIDSLLTVGPEGIFPLERGQNPEDGEGSGYDIQAMEWPATGFDIVKGTKASNADEIAILILGHATMQQTNGASVGASAATGNMIRGDKAIGDTLRESSWIYPLLRDWAEVNYGDPDCAPIPAYVIEEPSANVAAAQTSQFVSVSLPTLEHYGVDTVEFLRRFNFPLVDSPPRNPGPPPQPTKPPQETA